jgi:hypothetical protein
LFSRGNIDFKGRNDQNVKLLGCGFTAPGGLHIVAPDEAHLGTINPGVVVANCAWGNDGSVLYIAATNAMQRIRLNTQRNGILETN